MNVLEESPDQPRAPKIMFLVTEDWYFCSHRLPLARAALARDCEVVVVTRVDTHGDLIRSTGARLISIRMRRRGVLPWQEFAILWRLWRIYREERPDIVHHVALKPVLYGSIVAWLTGVPAVVNALAGLGYIYTPGPRRSRLLRRCMSAMLGAALRAPGSQAIVQNPDDGCFLERLEVEPSKISVIRGSGADVSKLQPSHDPPEPVVVALVSRMLWDKGVGEFVEAARIIRDMDPEIRFVLVGAPDRENPASIPEAELRAWSMEGVVEWHGFCDDVAAVWARSHIAVLPSYREGLPKSLLEAAACGRPMIATDVPGCREIVRDGVTGRLIPARDSRALVEAILQLASDRDLRIRMGQAGRSLIENEFSLDRVVSSTLSIYERILGDRWRV